MSLYFADLTLSTVLDPPAGSVLVTCIADAINNVVQGGSVTFDPTANDFASDGSEVRLVSVSSPPGGQGSVSHSGDNVTYTAPAAGFTGLVALAYTVDTATGGSATGSISLTVRAPAAPTVTCVTDSWSVRRGLSVVFDPTTNDTASDSSAVSITSLGALPAGRGSIGRSGDTVTYTAPDDWSGTFSITYNVSTPTGGVGSGTINLTVETVTPTVTCVDDSFEIDQGQSHTFDPTANDSTNDGATISVISVADPPQGQGTKTRAGNQVTYTAPASSFTGIAAFSYFVRSSTGATGQGTINATVRGGGPAPAAWWRQNWRDPNKAPLSGRGWNVGVFADTTGISPWVENMGYFPEIVGGNCIQDWERAQTWNDLMGGAASLGGDRHPDAGTMLHLASGRHTRGWITRQNGVGRNTWLVVMHSTLPRTCTPADAVVDHSSKWRIMGQRMRWHIDKTVGVNWPDAYKYVILRSNWEGQNQNTALSINGQQWYAAGLTTAQYKTMMTRFINSFQAGYGHPIPVAFSPAMNNTNQAATVIASEGGTYAWYRNMMTNVPYAMACGSFHPRDDRCLTDSDAAQLVHGGAPYTQWNTPALVIRAARALGLPCCFLEWGAYPNPAAMDQRAGVDRFYISYREFGDLLAANSDIVTHTCALASATWSPGGDLADAHPGWKRMCEMHIAKFGKVP